MSPSQTAGGLDRGTPPAGWPATPAAFPTPRRFRLANGLTLLAARSTRAPLASLELLVDAGSQDNPLDRPGLASLTAALLDEGTHRRSGRQIAAEVERLGGGLGTGATWDSTSIGLDLPAAQLASGLDLLAEIFAQASFPEADLERLRRQRLGEILQRRSRPEALADEQIAHAIYGSAPRRWAPYGYPAIGTEESLRAISRDELVDFYERRLRLPAAATLIVVGDFEPERLHAEVERRFGELAGERSPALEEKSRAAQADLAAGIQPAEGAGGEPQSDATDDTTGDITDDTVPPTQPRVVLVDRPGGAQTELRVGHAGVPRNHPDFLDLRVMSSLLGGKFTSRLNLNLRERHGFTYGVRSHVTGRHGPGPIFVATAVATDVAGAATREIFHELRRIREEPVTNEELEDTRNYLIGTFPLALQSLNGIAGRLEQIAVYGLPDDHWSHYLDAVAGVTRERIQKAARAHLAPDHAVTVAVGPVDTLAPQLEALGEIQVVEPLASLPEADR